MECLKHFRQDIWNTPERLAAIEVQMDCLDFNGKHVLDLACRFGLFACLSLSKGAKFVTGFDIKEGMIAKANVCLKDAGCDEKNYSVGVGDVFESRFWEYKPDLILCLGLIYHTQRQLQLLSLIRKADCPVILEGMVSNKIPRLPVVIWGGGGCGPFIPNSLMYESMFERTGFDFSDRVLFNRRVIYRLQPNDNSSYMPQSESLKKPS